MLVDPRLKLLSWRTEWPVPLPRNSGLAVPDHTCLVSSLLSRRKVFPPWLAPSRYYPLRTEVIWPCAVASADCTLCDPDNAACMAVHTASEIFGYFTPNPNVRGCA